MPRRRGLTEISPQVKSLSGKDLNHVLPSPRLEIEKVRRDRKKREDAKL